VGGVGGEGAFLRESCGFSSTACVYPSRVRCRRDGRL
jgi:hypothetical protein